MRYTLLENLLKSRVDTHFVFGTLSNTCPPSHPLECTKREKQQVLESEIRRQDSVLWLYTKIGYFLILIKLQCVLLQCLTQTSTNLDVYRAHKYTLHFS